ncbi:MAG: GNAT family N-acetyltransferase [Alphaproteobacteria bacterium]|nr:GNAT family N-acetyltransferase [Alphaproteobacteria bacterium]
MDDVSDIQKLFNHWDIVKFTRAPWPLPENAALMNMRDKTLPAMEEGKQFSWAITLKESGEFMGRVDYRLYDGQKPDRGFFMGIPFQGKGYMTEAVMVTQDFMFFEYGLEVLIVKNALSNEASRKIKQKTGAEYVGVEDDTCGHLGDKTEVWKVTREGWERARSLLSGSL